MLGSLRDQLKRAHLLRTPPPHTNTHTPAHNHTHHFKTMQSLQGWEGNRIHIKDVAVLHYVCMCVCVCLCISELVLCVGVYGGGGVVSYLITGSDS